jgi:ABC-type transport system involved in cytochrome c biogenesis permease subunit
MNRTSWRTTTARLALALLLGIPMIASAGEKPVLPGSGPAYDAIAKLPMMNDGRIKPLDTVARVEVKRIHGRESITLEGPDEKPIGKWGPVAAFYGWMVDPEFWDEQPFILVDYLPLKWKIMAGAVKGRLAAIADEPTNSEPARKMARELAGRDEVSDTDLRGLAALPGIIERDQKGLKELIEHLGPGRKFLTPRELDEATVHAEGRSFGFRAWTLDIRRRQADAEGTIQAFKKESISEVEKKALEVSDRLLRYRNIRGDSDRMMAPIDLFVPRPNSKEFLTFSGKIFRQLTAMSTADRQARANALAALSPLQEDTAMVLNRFLTTLQGKDRKEPGTDEEFDREFSTWLQEDADWMSLKVLLNSNHDELASAGFPREQVEALSTSYTALKEMEAAEPGHAPADKAEATVAAARALGEALAGPGYPGESAIARETRFNAIAPFYKAPMAYGFGFVLLLLSLCTVREGQSRGVALGKALYYAGLAAFVGGIGLEVYGFCDRIRISGWAPVTNMYETVIWVGLVSAVIALMMEAIYPRRFPALGGALAGLLCTLVAASAGSTILDPSIKSIPPVLRSNYWLTIHVLTIVSSYAAFALAMVIGLFASWFYMTASYRRRVRYTELLLPVLIGLPIAFLGTSAYWAAKEGPTINILRDPAVALSCGLIGLLGVAACLSPIPGFLGEWLSRRWLLQTADLSDDSLVGDNVTVGAVPLARPGWSLAPTAVGGTVLAVSLVAVVSGAMLISRESGSGITFLFMGLMGSGVGALIVLSQIPTLIKVIKRRGAETATAEIESRDEPVSYLDEGAGGGVATLAPPTVAERVRAASANVQLKLDARTAAMRLTAAIVKPLANFVYRAMQVGVLLVAAGTFLGGWWADKSWGRFWGWDPKEVWALITLLFYLVPLHGRFAGWINTWWLVFCSVFCFGSVMMAWYGVNFVLGVGLHSYGFSEGGGQELVGLAMAAVMAPVVAAGWRRHRGLSVG